MRCAKVVDVIYLDFSKAFDKVDHGILLKKMVDLGVRKELLGWIASFLTGLPPHCSKVEVNGCVSRNSIVRSGVPQGSVLGPLLFLIFIADIDRGISRSQISSFADDTRILKEIRTSEDCGYLQEDLDKIFLWVEQNNMALNEGKFEAIRYGNHPAQNRAYKTPTGTEVEFKNTIKDLGVLVQSDGKFGDHISNLVMKCRRKMGWILRVFTTRDQVPMMTLYKSLVVPIAEYCCQLWNPAAVGLITAVEGIQRTFTSKIAGMQNLSYWERLKRLNLYSLQRRRERYLVIYVWKIIQGLSPNFKGDDLKIKNYGDGSASVSCQLPSTPFLPHPKTPRSEHTSTPTSQTARLIERLTT